MSTPSVPDISIQNVTKRFGERLAVDAFSLDVPQGAFVTLLGPSGCGKTTLLRVIGGFETPDVGTVAIRGESMAGRPPHQRPTAMVFQRYALFPHLTVAENIGFGLRMQRMARPEIAARTTRLLELVDLAGFGERMPSELSGGQQQRVALARALAAEPALLLLDEPLGALDMTLRRQMQVELKTIQRRSGVTFVSVTHDQEEALAMSDLVVVMNGGRIEQVAPPAVLFDRPQTRFVAGFLGSQTIDAEVVSRADDGVTVRFGGGELFIPGDAPVGVEVVTLAIRPERIRLDASGEWKAQVRDQVYKGAVVSLLLELADGSELVCDVRHEAVETLPNGGDSVRLAVRPDDVWVIPEGAAEPVPVRSQVDRLRELSDDRDIVASC